MIQLVRDVAVEQERVWYRRTGEQMKVCFNNNYKEKHAARAVDLLVISGVPPEGAE